MYISAERLDKYSSSFLINLDLLLVIINSLSTLYTISSKKR